MSTINDKLKRNEEVSQCRVDGRYALVMSDGVICGYIPVINCTYRLSRKKEYTTVLPDNTVIKTPYVEYYCTKWRNKK